jgi:hypothetical protein
MLHVCVFSALNSNADTSTSNVVSLLVLRLCDSDHGAIVNLFAHSLHSLSSLASLNRRYEGDHGTMIKAFQPLVDWATKAGGTIKPHVSGSISWNNTATIDWKAGGYPVPWLWRHPAGQCVQALHKISALCSLS